MIRIGLCACLTVIATFGASAVASATDRTYINTTGEDLVIYLCPVYGQKYGEWINSGTIAVDKSWTVKVNDPPSNYVFTLYFPQSKEQRALGIKTVNSPAPMTVAVERRQRVKPQQRTNDQGQKTFSNPPPEVEEYFELVPVKPQGQ